MVRVVSRCATGCREPHTYSADASPSSHAPSVPRRTLPLPPPARPPRAPAPVIYCPGVPKGPRHAGRGRNFPRSLAKLELRSSFRDRLMFRRFIKTEKRRGSRLAAAADACLPACLRYALSFNRQASEPHICSSRCLLALFLSRPLLSDVPDLCSPAIDTRTRRSTRYCNRRRLRIYQSPTHDVHSVPSPPLKKIRVPLDGNKFEIFCQRPSKSINSS